MTFSPAHIQPKALYSCRRGPTLRGRRLPDRMNKDELHMPSGGCFYPEHPTVTLPVLFLSVDGPCLDPHRFVTTLCHHMIGMLSVQKAADGKRLEASQWSNWSSLFLLTGRNLPEHLRAGRWGGLRMRQTTGSLQQCPFSKTRTYSFLSE